MKYKYVLALCFFISAIVKTNHSNAQVNKQDSLALVDFYYSTGGPQWNYQGGWLTAPIYQWYGVRISDNRVTGLDMSEPPDDPYQPDWEANHITGHFPLALTRLTALKKLDLTKAYGINGTIPDFIGRLTSLETLILANTSLTGPIPDSIGNLINLIDLRLNNSQLSGDIPPSFNNLKKLSVLNLSRNKLGPVFPSGFLSAHPALEYADFEYNEFKTIPGFDSSSKVTQFSLAHNLLTGPIPTWVTKLVNLTNLDLSYNKLTGGISAAIGKLVKLEDLNFEHNELSGKIPESIQQLSKLQYLHLDNNKLTGSIPSLPNSPSLYSITLNNNRFSGTLPDTYSEWIREIDFSHNELMGPIPSTIFELTDLEKLRLNNNKLSGSFPLLEAYHNIDSFTAGHNKFNYDGLEVLAQKFNKAHYTPQDSIALHQVNGKLSTYAGGTLANNIFYWYRNGSFYRTIRADSVFTPTLSGSYFVKVKNKFAPKIALQSTTLNISAGSLRQGLLTAYRGVSQEIINVKGALNVYPNPAKSNTIILFAASGKYNLLITDMYGKTIQQKTGAAFKGQNIVSFNISNYAPGIYEVTLTDEKGIKRSCKLVKE